MRRAARRRRQCSAYALRADALRRGNRAPRRLSRGSLRVNQCLIARHFPQRLVECIDRFRKALHLNVTPRQERPFVACAVIRVQPFRKAIRRDFDRRYGGRWHRRPCRRRRHRRTRHRTRCCVTACGLIAARRHHDVEADGGQHDGQRGNPDNAVKRFTFVRHASVLPVKGPIASQRNKSAGAHHRR